MNIQASTRDSAGLCLFYGGMLTVNAQDYLRDYPLTVEQQELVDIANRGNLIPLVGRLSGAKSAISKLHVDKCGHHKNARMGLHNYYQGQLRGLISLVKNRVNRESLERIYLGDD